MSGYRGLVWVSTKTKLHRFVSAVKFSRFFRRDILLRFEVKGPAITDKRRLNKNDKELFLPNDFLTHRTCVIIDEKVMAILTLYFLLSVGNNR